MIWRRRRYWAPIPSSSNARIPHLSQSQCGSARVALMREQPFFALQAAAEARQRAVGTDDAMTGNDDGNGIASIREADGARAVGIANALGELTIAPGFAEGYFCELAPHPLLKFAALHFQGQIEFAPSARKIFFQLAHGGRERALRGVLHPVSTRGRLFHRLVPV